MANKKTKWRIEFDLKQTGMGYGVNEEIEAGLEQFIHEVIVEQFVHEMIVSGFDVGKIKVKEVK